MEANNDPKKNDELRTYWHVRIQGDTDGGWFAGLQLLSKRQQGLKSAHSIPLKTLKLFEKVPLGIESLCGLDLVRDWLLCDKSWDMGVFLPTIET